jgi:uncharacterized membrane protein
MQRLGFDQDLLFISSLSVVAPLATCLGSSRSLHVLLGFGYLLLAPGYALVAALFPRKFTPTGVERLVLSLGLSVVTVPLMGLLLNYTLGDIRLDSVLISTSVFVLLNCAFASYRRRRLPFHERFIVQFRFHRPNWHTIRPLDGLLSVALVVSMMTACGTLVYTLVQPRVGETFTEFYVLGPGGTATGYPAVVTPYEPITLIFGVVNHEHVDAHYRIEKRDDTSIEQIVSLQLVHEERWEQPYTFGLTEPTEPGENRRVSFLLYRDGQPYRSLHLWVAVKEDSSKP